MNKLTMFLALVFSSAALADNVIDQKCNDFVVWGAPVVIGKTEQQVQYMCRAGYGISYNYEMKAPFYVVEHVKAVNLNGKFKRKNNFHVDKDLPEKYRVSPSDYDKSGYDRGHVAPADDFTYSEEAMDQSFLMSNMMAQVPGNNRGIWKKTEELQRQWATTHGEVYVISGPIYKAPLVVFNGIAVPTAVYKIVIDPKKSSMIGFVFPNQSLPVDKLTDYITPINDIEQMVGINFSPKLPINMKKLELDKGDYSEW